MGIHGGSARGGGVYVGSGSVLVDDGSSVNSNLVEAGNGGAGGAGGSSFSQGGSGGTGAVGGSASGGGIYIGSGTAIISDDATVNRNSALAGLGGAGGAGGDAGTHTGAIAGNGGFAGDSGSAFGGGIFAASGNVTVNVSTVASNLAAGQGIAAKGGAGGNAAANGGQAGAGGFGGAGVSAFGGGIYDGNGDVNIWEHASIAGNQAAGNVGGAGGGVGFGAIPASGGVGGNGGSAQGGGVYLGGGTLTLDHVSIDSNKADGNLAGGSGGHDQPGGAGGDADGGGLYAASGASNLTIQNSSVTNNSAGAGGTGGKGAAGDGAGGNSLGGGLDSGAANTLVSNSTIAFNVTHAGGESSSQEGESQGGGAFLDNGTNATIDNATIAHNTSNNEGGGIRNEGTLSLRSTLVADNTSAFTGETDLSDAGNAAASSSLIQNGTGNAIVDGANGNIVGTQDSALNLASSLTTAPNGTRYLGFTSNSSVAFQAGANPENLTVDQIDKPRVVNGKVDIGAIETGGSTASVSLVAVAGKGGVVKLIDSNTGVVYQSFQPFGAGYAGVVSVALGDVNEDGIPELIVAARNANDGRVLVFDGAAAIQPGIDLGNPSTWSNGSMSILPHGGATPVLATLTPFRGYTGGLDVASADVNGDGHSDIIVGTAAGVVAKVVVFDGASPSTKLGKIAPFGAHFTGGVSVTGGDVTGDGIADVIVGTESHRAKVSVFELSGGVFSQVGAILRPFGLLSGGVQVTALDVTGGGISDIAVGMLSGGAANVVVMDGSGNQVATYSLGSGLSTFGIGKVDPSGNGDDSLLFEGIPAVGNPIEILNPMDGSEVGSLSVTAAVAGGISVAGG
jgi:hypothetical protein